MENALWNGKLLMATEIARDYQLEKESRKASGHKELCSPDPQCQHPILRYCHGEKKDAFFGHLNNEHCDYAYFDRENTQIVRTIKRRIYESFKSKGYRVTLEVKILDHHYAHILFDMDDGSKVAIEIGTQRLSANRIDTLTDEYQKKGIAVKWIVIGNTNIIVRENQTYFLKRYLLNESKNKDLLVVNWDSSEIVQYKVYSNKYEYNGRVLTSKNYPETYSQCASLNELIIDNGELTLVGFNESYLKWLKRKHIAFEKRVQQLENEKKQHIEDVYKREQAIKRLYQEHQTRIKNMQQLSSTSSTVSPIPISCVSAESQVANKTYNQYKDEILSLIEQQDTPVRDSKGSRWVKCKKCGRIDTEEEFVSYGGKNHVNLGLCNSCGRNGYHSS